MKINSASIYDTMYIGSALQKRLNDFSHYEIQLFGYLSCLLSLYEGNPVSAWGYSFIKNELGSPYSRELEESLNALISRKLFEETDGGFFKLSDAGNIELSKFSTMHSNQARHKYLNASCSSIQLLPYGVVKDSITKEPILQSANHHQMRRLLTDDDSPAFTALYEQFDMLKAALSDQKKSLIIPAVVWLEYLNKSPNVEVSHDN